MNNIPIPSKNAYLKQFMWKLESFITRLRWKVFFFEHPEAKTKSKNNFGLASTNAPPKSASTKRFEDDLYNLVQSVEYIEIDSKFQKTLKKDLRQIRKSHNVIVFADKTNNVYEIERNKYANLLSDNITQTYKKSDIDQLYTINREASLIAREFDIEDRMEVYAQNEAYVTLKDHKQGFPNKIKCRLINPAKSETGIVSKHILQNLNKAVRNSTGMNQWRNTNSVLEWFNKLPTKRESSFLKFDIVEFYPSISETLLNKALQYASNYVKLSDKEINMIFNARKSLLFSHNEPWCKKDGTFDVTMGSYDGAEVCETVGLFMLNKISSIIDKACYGLYRDDGLAVLRNYNPKKTDNLRKQLIKLFKEEGLSITIETNLKTTDFLDIHLNLESNSHGPYTKPNSKIHYINLHSNHPKAVTKQLPLNINQRLNGLSSSIDEFNKAKAPYQTALKNAGYKHVLEFDDKQKTEKPKRRRKRDILWFNPPMNKAVSTRVGAEFLKLVDIHFPKHNKLHSIINRNTVKISYSCMSNMANLIKSHNKNILNPKQKTETCNCKNECPLDGECRSKCIVYKATVSTTTESKIYFGSTETPFKLRLANHKNSFKDEKKRNVTELAKYIWEKKKNHEIYSLKWEIAARANPCHPGSRKCNLCLTEKLLILTGPTNMLNTRDELISGCRHRAKFKLGKIPAA